MLENSGTINLFFLRLIFHRHLNQFPPTYTIQRHVYVCTRKCNLGITAPIHFSYLDMHYSYARLRRGRMGGNAGLLFSKDWVESNPIFLATSDINMLPELKWMMFLFGKIEKNAADAQNTQMYRTFARNITFIQGFWFKAEILQFKFTHYAPIQVIDVKWNYPGTAGSAYEYQINLRTELRFNETARYTKFCQGLFYWTLIRRK